MIYDPKPIAPINPKGLDEVARALLESKPSESESTQGNASLEDRTDFWSISGVAYRSGIYTVDLSKARLDRGSSKTQDQWSAYSKQAIAKDQFHVGDFPLYHSLFTTLFRNRDGPDKTKIENIQAFLKDNLFKHWLMTLTRIRYAPSGKDVVIHNHGLKDRYEIQEDIVDPDEWVKNAASKAPYKALLGTDNTAEIQAVYNWLTGKDTYLWRVNAKPDAVDERVAWFGADSGGLFLGCGGGQRDSYSALGVRARAEGTPHQ